MDNNKDAVYIQQLRENIVKIIKNGMRYFLLLLFKLYIMPQMEID